MLIAGAIVVRAIVFALRGDHLDWDEALYLLIARNIADGAGITLNGYPHTALGPFVPLATAALAALPGIDLHVAHRVLVVVLGGLLLAPVYYLIRLSAGRRLALLAALLLVGWPALVDVAPKLGPMWRHLYAGTEPIFLTLLFGSLALGELGLRDRGRWRTPLLLAAGVLVGCAYLARPEAVVVAGLYAAFRVAPGYRERPVGRVLPALAVAALGALLVAAPYLYHTRQVTGSWTPNGKLAPTRMSGDLYQSLVLHDRHMGAYLRSWWALDPGHRYLLNPYWGADPDVPDERRLAAFEAKLEEEWDAEEGGSPILQRGWAYARALWKLSGPLLLPLALLGLFAGRRDLRRLMPPFVPAGFAASALTLAAVFALPRFFLYLIPVFALWSANGILVLGDRVGSKMKVSLAFPLGVAVALASLVMGAVGSLGQEADELRDFAADNRMAASRLAEAIPENRRVMAWHPRLAYWGGFSWRALPVAPLEATVHYALVRETFDLFLVQGMYTPLSLTAPYVLIRIDPELAPEFQRAAGPDPAARHRHPPTELVPVEPVADFPTGIVRSRPPDDLDGG